MSNVQKLTGAILVLLAIALFVLPLSAKAVHEEGHTEDPPPDSTAAPFDFSNEGIFGCNQVSGASGSAGTQAAIGGVYVPVNDAAVTLNTGILVYKECVLRPLQVKLREAAVVAIAKKNIIGFDTGRSGNKQYVVNLPQEVKDLRARAAITYLKGSALEKVHAAYREEVRRALARNVQTDLQGNPKEDCEFEGDLKATAKSPTAVPTTLAQIEALEPSCVPFFIFMEKQLELDMAQSEAVTNQMTQWDWGRGVYPVTDGAEDPSAEKTLTPSVVVQESFQEVFSSPVRQLEQANDIGQIIGALFSGVTTQALTDTRGLAGLLQGTGGRPSYLDQVTRESSQSVIGAAVNAALTILNAARQTEAAFLAAMNAIATTLTNTINQLRQTETQCWALVVPKVKDYANANGIELDPRKISAATSSLAFAQQVIDAQVTPLANIALTNVQSSQKALGLIDQLIAGVTNTTSVSAQRLALQQLDTLVSQKALHLQYDVNRANQQKEDVAVTMAALITDTAKAWADSTDPSIGWCNINNPAVIEQWAERWKK